MTLEAAKGIVRVEAGTTPAEELSFRPRALVLWWSRERSAGCAGGIGFATDGAGEASTAWVADDTLAPGVLSRCGTGAPLLFHDDPRTPDASLPGHVRFADRGFSFDCDREPEHPWLVHYLALGGSDVHSAAVRSLVLDASGTRSVTGLGFTPGVVLATVGAGSSAGEPQSGLAVAFGAASASSDQLAGGFVAQTEDEEMIVRGAQCTGAVAVLPAVTASAEIAALSRLVSFDRDGFTLETTHLASELPLAVLALGGGSYTVGRGVASSRPTRVGFEPAGALLFGTGLTAVSRSRDFGRLCLGGFSRDGRAGCLSWSYRARPLGPRSRSSSEAPFEVMDTTSGELHARATLSALGRRRFSLSWVRDRPPRDFGFVGFGPELRKPTLGDRLRRLGRGGSLRK
jgi:hypothetical protein